MEGFTPFLGTVMLVFGILQIILFFKMWGMTNDMSDVAKNMKALTRHFCKEEYIKACGYTLESKGITYTQKGSKITFSDGVQGVVNRNLNWYSFITDDNEESLYPDMNSACTALHEYLTTGNILQKDIAKDRSFFSENDFWKADKANSNKCL